MRRHLEDTCSPNYDHEQVITYVLVAIAQGPPAPPGGDFRHDFLSIKVQEWGFYTQEIWTCRFIETG